MGRGERSAPPIPAKTVWKVPKIAAVHVIGLMSGTSADGIDAALVEWPDGPEARPFRLLAHREIPHEPALRDRIHALAAGRTAPGETLQELARLHATLGDRFAEAALAVAAEAGIDSIDAVASHGQTVGHYPEDGATLQIGDPSRIAERTGWTTVADFRPRDVAAGGEGAPLAPFFHLAAFGTADETRVVLNLGGIANVTGLPRGADPDAVVAFDTGPANSLIDGVITLASEGAKRMDRGGLHARAGTVASDWLAELLDDDYFRRPPPKSTGRERYGLAEAEALLTRARKRGVPLDDLVATLVALTAESVVAACRDFLPGAEGLDRMIVGGGGAENPALMAALAERLPGVVVKPFDAHGVPRGAAEAMAFSLLGRNALLGLPNHLPRTTGAKHATVLGVIVPGGPGLPVPVRVRR